MQWEWIIVLVIAVPVILFPAAYVWYINIKSIAGFIRNTRIKKANRTVNDNLKKKTAEEQEYEKALTAVLEKYPW
jgi:hypothetical protein